MSSHGPSAATCFPRHKLPQRTLEGGPSWWPKWWPSKWWPAARFLPTHPLHAHRPAAARPCCRAHRPPLARPACACTPLTPPLMRPQVAPHGVKLVAESNADMRGTYAMLDARGR